MKRYFPSIKTLLLVLSTVCFLAACSSTDSGKATDEFGNPLSESNLNAEREGRYAGGAIPLAEDGGMFRDINFGYDSSAIDDLGRQNLEQNVQVLQSNPNIRVQLEGHCDERGTAEYNLALGSRRAQAVYDLLISYGIPASRLETISYGEEVPLDPASNEMAWARNRRVHFSAFTTPQR
ncbi:MAG: OmpA family protein [Bdellovibrionota bacterium]|jgi:peptidoglycan-associated lipoprotein